MPRLTYEFYKTVIEVLESDMISKSAIFPLRTSAFVNNHSFTPEWLVHYMQQQADNETDDEVWKDGGHCYQYIFEELQSNDDMTILCDSHEIGEYDKDIAYGGDFRYFYGYLPNEIAYIYHQGQAEMFELPHRLTIYGKEYTIELRCDSKFVEIYKTIPKYRNLFYLPNPLDIVTGLIYMLKNTDRNFFED